MRRSFCSPARLRGGVGVLLALLGLSAAEKGREGTTSVSEAGGIRACRVGQFPRRPICRVGRFPCRVGQFPVAQRGHSFADMRSPCRRTRARTWRRPPSSTSSPSPAPPPLPSPWRTGGAPRRVAHRLFRHEQELRHGGPAKPRAAGAGAAPRGRRPLMRACYFECSPCAPGSRERIQHT